MPDKTPAAALAAWLTEWQDEITQAQEFTKSELPSDANLIQTDLSRTTREYPRMAELLADMEGHVIRLRAHETLQVRKEYEDLTAHERKSIVEDRLRPALRIREILKATCRALSERSFALMSQRAYEREALRLAGRGEAA